MIVSDRQNARRRGLTVVAVLVCLILITMVSGAVLKVGLARREQLRSRERRLQAEWLAEAGCQRALARLAIDPSYAGETWEVPARDLDSADPALIAIVVEREPGGPNRRTVRVQADYPRDPPRRARCTRALTVTTPAK